MGRNTEMVKRLTVIARMDDSGLGHQTRDLVRLLNPNKVVAIDFSFYNQFKQHPEWYENLNTKYIKGFLQDDDVREILDESDIVLTCETFYNNNFIQMARDAGVVSVNQVNYEFFEQLQNRTLPIPHKILMPSYWHLEDVQNLTRPGQTIYLPPPTFVEDFDDVRKTNYARKGKKRFLHIAGKIAAQDRAGTLDLLEAIKLCNADFELVIKVHSGEIPFTNDTRVVLDYNAPDDERELYRDFDAMIHPRRYAGLNLPMNEALASGLPVIMTDVSPNNKVLPKDWLILSHFKGTFFARTEIDIFSCDHDLLATKIDKLANMNSGHLLEEKRRAYEIAVKEYSPKELKPKWERFLNGL